MQIVIIGSGIAGITFAEKTRALNPKARITILTQETYGYYSRPILSHGFSQENIEQNIVLKTFAQLEQNNIHITSGVEVTAINRKHQQIAFKTDTTQDDDTLKYDTLILAQGSSAFIPPPFRPYRDQFFLFNNLADLKLLRQFRQPFVQSKTAANWAIIGGGLIGCELASDLATAGDRVTLFHAMDRLMERQLVPEDSETLLAALQSAGLNVLLDQSVQSFASQGDKKIVQAETPSSTDKFDGIIVSCGFLPRTGLALDAGLDIGRGVQVDQFLQTSDEHIYALGDVAELPNKKLYAFIMPIRSQALWLANYLNGAETAPCSPPIFNPKAKVHGFKAANPYIF